MKTKGDECDIHFWKKYGDDNMVDIFTISKGKMAICVDLPMDEALKCLREYLECL